MPSCQRGVARVQCVLGVLLRGERALAERARTAGLRHLSFKVRVWASGYGEVGVGGRQEEKELY